MLSKTLFKIGVECPRKLFYAQQPQLYRNANDSNAFLKSLAIGGMQVGELAKRFFPGGSIACLFFISSHLISSHLSLALVLGLPSFQPYIPNIPNIPNIAAQPFLPVSLTLSSPQVLMQAYPPALAVKNMRVRPKGHPNFSQEMITSLCSRPLFNMEISKLV